MVSSKELSIVDLTLDDVDAALMLSFEAGWNQISDDWKLFIEHGKTIGFRDSGGHLIASAAALPYATSFGFISMVLVTQKWRRLGLATRLVDRCIKWLQKQQLIPMLDATNDGAKVYRKQGFLPLFELDRWQLKISTNQVANQNMAEEFATGYEHQLDSKKLICLDAEVCGAGRAFLMDDFCARNEVKSIILPDENGFGMIRAGSCAFQIGPVVAPSQGSAIDLISQLLSVAKGTVFKGTVFKGAVFIDVPKKAVKVGQWLQDNGFTRQRSFIRMALGQSAPLGSPQKLFASAGPEFG